MDQSTQAESALAVPEQPKGTDELVKVKLPDGVVLLMAWAMLFSSQKKKNKKEAQSASTQQI